MSDALLIPWHRAVPVETRDGRRKAEAVCVDWLGPPQYGRPASVAGHLPNRYETRDEVVRVKRDPDDIAAEIAKRAAAGDKSELDLYVKPVTMPVTRCVSEGGWLRIETGDWIVRTPEGGCFAVPAAEWGRDWIEPVAEAARVAAIKAKADAERAEKAAAEAREEEERKARTLAEARRIMEDKAKGGA